MGDTQLFSERNAVKFFHDGAAFVFDKSSKDGMKKFWRCDQRNHKCIVSLSKNT